MVVEFDKCLLLDVKKIRDKEIRKRIKTIILQIERIENISEITSLKKLEKYETYYRIKIKLDEKRNYRIGMIIRGKKVWLVRCLSRTKIYRKFP